MPDFIALKLTLPKTATHEYVTYVPLKARQKERDASLEKLAADGYI